MTITLSEPKAKSCTLKIDTDQYNISDIDGNIAEYLLDNAIDSLEDNTPFEINFENYDLEQISIHSDNEGTIIKKDNFIKSYPIKKESLLNSIYQGIAKHLEEWVVPESYRTQINTRYKEAINEYKKKCLKLNNLLIEK